MARWAGSFKRNDGADYDPRCAYGKERVNPLVYLPDGKRVVIFASKAGAPTNTDWFHNLRANPIVGVEVGTERYQARAVIIEGEERDRLCGASQALLRVRRL